MRRAFAMQFYLHYTRINTNQGKHFVRCQQVNCGTNKWKYENGNLKKKIYLK